MKSISRKNLIFGVTKQDVRQLALESLDRNLTPEEENRLANIISTYFAECEWDNWIKELIESTARI